MQELCDAEFQPKAHQAELADLKVQLEGDLLSQRASVASVAAEYHQASLLAHADEHLHAAHLIGDLTPQLSRTEVA